MTAPETPRLVRIACVQVAPRVGDLAHNRDLAVDAIARAADAGAELVVLPELATSGYVFESADEARSLAEPPDGPALTAWAEAAGRAGVTVVGGFCEAGEDGRLYNSAALVDADGTRLVYRKVHLWDRERLVFTPGGEPPPVLDYPFGRLAVLVCYDLEFAEYVHVVALTGADLLCVPTNWPAEPRPAGERAMELMRAQVVAHSNRVWVAACDRHGTERGVEWVGGSSIIGPDGWFAGGPLGGAVDGMVVADCDLALARRKALNERNDVFADRFPGLYAAARERATTPAVDPV